MSKSALARDVDQIGFVNALVSHHANDLKSSVKVRMDEQELERVSGDYFEALLVRAEASTIDPAKLLALYTKDKINRAQLLSALAVKKEPLKKFLTGDEIERMSEASEGTLQLRVKQIEGVELELVDAVKNLAIREPA